MHGGLCSYTRGGKGFAVAAVAAIIGKALHSLNGGSLLSLFASDAGRARALSQLQMDVQRAAHRPWCRCHPQGVLLAFAVLLQVLLSRSPATAETQPTGPQVSWTWTSGASKPGFGHAVMTPWCAAPQVVAAMAPAALAFYLPIGLALWSQRIHCSPNVDVGLGAARWARWAAERMRVSWRVVVKAFTSLHSLNT